MIRKYLKSIYYRSFDNNEITKEKIQQLRNVRSYNN